MSPLVAPTTEPPHIARPLKRSRKESKDAYSRDSEEHQQYQQPSPPMDHIFISESLTNKKAGGKKAPLSCCECRRLKLKCDRTFPCGSCKKRGVSDICPDGVLVSGKGTRFVLANTEQLHTKIHEMSDRLRLVEEALRHYNPDHPLLDSELLNIKRTVELYGNAHVGANENPSTSPSKSSPDPSSSMDVDYMPDSTALSKVDRETPESLEMEIKRLSISFPLTENLHSKHSMKMRSYIRKKLPLRSEAEYLWEQAKHNALWQYNPHPNEVFFPNLLHHCYEIPIEEVSTRRLALMFMILAIGCLVDLDRRGPDSPDAEAYHILGRAALCGEGSVMEDTDMDTITALFYEIWILTLFSDKKKATGYAWGLMGLAAKLAQSIGLHRNGTKAKVIPEEVDKRRSLFWELLYLDARLSLSLGRPPSLSMAHTDCPQPSYQPTPGDEASASLQYYQEWKHTCYVNCLAPVLDAISQPTLEYSTVIELDRKIREFSIPVAFKHASPHTRSAMMQKASIATALEAVLLQLHRTFFTRAVSGTETAFNRSNLYAPSVVAIFLSASRMIATIQDLYHREPELTARILGYWSNAFSATVALCLLVSRAPFTCLTPAALQELERSRALFISAKDTCPRANQVLPVLETMVAKANDIYTRWSNGQDVPTVVLRHSDDSWYSYAGIMAPSTTTDSFKGCHRSLIQCIAEVHDRAKLLFPLRKPCTCATRTTQAVVVPEDCPPSHSWAPRPDLIPTVPVLPEVFLGKMAQGVVACGGTTVSPLSPTSRFSTENFDFGALNPSTGDSWMAWI